MRDELCQTNSPWARWGHLVIVDETSFFLIATSLNLTIRNVKIEYIRIRQSGLCILMVEFRFLTKRKLD